MKKKKRKHQDKLEQKKIEGMSIDEIMKAIEYLGEDEKIEKDGDD